MKNKKQKKQKNIDKSVQDKKTPQLHFHLGPIYFSSKRREVIFLILTIGITLGIGIPSLYYAMNPPIEEMLEEFRSVLKSEGITIEENEAPHIDTQIIQDCKTGEVGLTYRNCLLGYQISRPNFSWMLNKDINNVEAAQPFIEQEDYFLGGTIVEDSIMSTITILVYDQNDPTFYDFEAFLDLRINFLKNRFPNALIQNYTSMDKNSLVIEILGIDESVHFYANQRWEKHNDKVYLLQYSIKPPESIPKSSIEELKQVLNSFNYIS